MNKKNIELAESLLTLRDHYKNNKSEWEKDVTCLTPLILLLMEDQNTSNPIQAIMGPLRDAAKDNDVAAAQLMLAVAVELTIKLNNV